MTDMKAVDPREWITVSQAARMLQVSTGTVNRRVREGELRGVDIPGIKRSRVVWKPDVERILDERRRWLRAPEEQP